MFRLVNPTAERVRINSTRRANQRIRRAMENRIAYYAQHPQEIDGRLAELDREWDVERLIEVEAPSVSLLGLILGAAVDRRFLALPLLVQGMILLHALQGWYPLLPAMRRAGVRTEKEIAQERYALKLLRGDLDQYRTGWPQPGGTVSSWTADDLEQTTRAPESGTRA
jgi:hypothetical protein